MLRKLMGLSAAAAVLAISVAAQALTVTNRDQTEHSLKIAEQGAERTVTILPEQTLDDICAEGCTISVGKGEAMEFFGTETVMIENGVLELDE